MQQNFLKRYSVVLRRIWRYGIGPILVTVTLLGIGYLTPRKWGGSSPVDCRSQPFKLYVAGEAMHVNLILPVQNSAFPWNQFLPLDQIGRDALQNYQYLKFGWGDRHFYMNTPDWSQVQISEVLRSLFLPGNPTALHVQGYTTLPQDNQVELKCVTVSQQDYERLVEFLKASFQQDAQGNPIRLGDAYSDASGFYAATGHYSIARTCNTWAADGLDAANINTPLWSGLAPAVMSHIQSPCECGSIK